MRRIGIIGGSGLDELLETAEQAGSAATPYGEASAPVQRGRIGDRELLLLARHGRPRSIAPHAVNYRANLYLLESLGAETVIATNAVGGIAEALRPGDLVLPDQLIDYSWGRAATFSDTGAPRHVDFTDPYSPGLRDGLIAAAHTAGLRGWLVEQGVYGCTQGPRLETAAEIDRLERDGCTVVGMTGMPEAVLARELEIPYAAICLVVNKAAGRGDGPIEENEAAGVMARGVEAVRELLNAYLAVAR